MGKVYVVYQLICQVNGKIYIGCHQTNDLNDRYLGSGRRLTHAKRKHGDAAFKKEILAVFDNPADMFKLESELVNEEFLKRSDVYNETLGGHGGWQRFNSNSELQRAKSNKANEKKRWLMENDPEWRARELERKRAVLSKAHEDRRINGIADKTRDGFKRGGCKGGGWNRQSDEEVLKRMSSVKIEKRGDLARAARQLGVSHTHAKRLFDRAKHISV